MARTGHRERERDDESGRNCEVPCAHVSARGR